MSDLSRLSPTEQVPDRPFTDPAYIPRDLAAMRHMLATLRSTVSRPDGGDKAGLAALALSEPDGRAQAIIIARRAALVAGSEFAIVGFFGNRRHGVDPAPLHEADEALILEFADHPGILSYSRLELEGGGWGNMVLLTGAEAARAWHGSQRHAFAVRQLAPAFYHSVRLHNACLPGALLAPAEITLIRTRYYDYTDPIPWLAVREASPPAGV